MRGKPVHIFFQLSKSEAFWKALWRDHGDSIVDEHVEEFLGTRPERWWEYSAPRSPRGTYPGSFCDGKLSEPRQRISGVGKPVHEAICVVPRFPFGIPAFSFARTSINHDDRRSTSHRPYLKRHGV
jgi:hypothetical protein